MGFGLPQMARPAGDRNHTGFGWASADNHNWTDFNLFGITYGELEKAPWNAWDSVNKARGQP